MGKWGVGRVVAFVFAASVLWACSDAPRSSSGGIVWQTCDPSIVSERIAAILGSRIGCAILRVPLDHADPAKGTIDMALVRVAAGDPPQRRRAIFMNPGGPGGDGFGIALQLGAFFASADPTTPIGGKLRRLSDRYDVIGFSPRGVGHSTNLACELDASYRVELLATTDGSPENLADILQNQELDAAACRQSPLTPYINTDATARDMDLARRAMGDDQIDYLGYSYGTWLGIWYASLFPEHVGRMVIDSTVDYTSETLTVIGNGQAVPLQFVLDELVIPYAAAHDSTFGLGTADEIRALFGSLPVELQTVLSDRLYLELFTQKRAEQAVELLGAAKGVDRILRDHPGAPDAELLAATQSYAYAHDPNVDEAMANAAHDLMQGDLDLLHRIAKPVSIDPGNSVNKSVVCNDGPSSTDPTFWNEQLEPLRVAAPAYLHDRFELNCTTAWDGPTVEKPDVAGAREVPNILMVQDQYDAATPLPGALRTYDLLGNASLIYNSRSYTHGVFPAGSACVDVSVADFFLAAEVPQHFVTECVGEGLPGVEVAASAVAGETANGLPPELRAQAVPGIAGRTSDGFADGSLARAAMRAIHQTVVDAATRHRPARATGNASARGS